MRGPGPPDGSRGGFTLVELLVVVLVLGILAGLALPSLRRALHRADAARVVADVRTINQAALTHMTETGSFPGTGPLGSPPAEMASRLPDGFEFEYKGVLYRWSSLSLPSGANFWGSEDLGIIWIYYDPGSGIAEALQSHSGTSAFWTPSVMIFILAA